MGLISVFIFAFSHDITRLLHESLYAWDPRLSIMIERKKEEKRGRNWSGFDCLIEEMKEVRNEKYSISFISKHVY